MSIKDLSAKSTKGMFSFIDLAGSEKGTATGNSDVTTRYFLHPPPNKLY